MKALRHSITSHALIGDTTIKDIVPLCMGTVDLSPFGSDRILLKKGLGLLWTLVT